MEKSSSTEGLPTTLEKIGNVATHLPWISISSCFVSSLVEKSGTQNELFVAYIYGPALISLFGASSVYCCSFLYGTIG